MILGLDSMRRAYSYLRFSHPRQMKGDSRRRQTAFADQVAKKMGAILDDSLSLQDLGVSAFRGKNVKVGALSEFLDAVQTGRVSRGSILIVENIDRLSRNKVGIALQLFIQLLNHGITIVTADPERAYTQESINDVAALLEPIIYMSRAHDESRTKSMRSRAVWNQKKELAASEGKPLGIPPAAWMELTPGGYRLIPDRAATVRAIFRMATTEGLGKRRIVQTLAADPQRYPPFGEGKQWNERYVGLILTNRAAFGEYQRYTADPETGERAPQGEPIPNYFPAAVSEQDFYSAKAAMQRRKQRSGRPATGEANLFTGIVKSPIDGLSMHLRTPKTKPRSEVYLVSHAVWRGAKWDGSGRFAWSINYRAFESAVLSAVAELSPVDLQDREQPADEQENLIRELTDELIARDHTLRMLQDKINDPKTRPTAKKIYTESIDREAAAKEDTAKRLETLKADAVSGRPETLGETQSLIKLLANAKGAEAEKLRRRLKSRLRLIVDEIWVVIERLDHKRRVAHVKLYLRGGATRYLRVFSPAPPADSQAGIRVLNLEKKDFRKLNLETLT